MFSLVALLSVLDICHALLVLGATLVGGSLGATRHGFPGAILGLVLGFLGGNLAGITLHLGDMIVWSLFWVPRIRRDTERRDRILRDYQQRLAAQREAEAQNQAGP